MTVRYLEQEEFRETFPLALACFGDEEFLMEYYAGPVYGNRVAVLEKEGRPVSMVQLRPFLAAYGEETCPVHYILFVCTLPEERHKGHMDRLMEFVLEDLKKDGEAFAFLVAVDKAIYRHLGFVYDWPFREEEQYLLFADDGLTDCSAKLLCGKCFTAPDRLLPASGAAAGL